MFPQHWSNAAWCCRLTMSTDSSAPPNKYFRWRNKLQWIFSKNMLTLKFICCDKYCRTYWCGKYMYGNIHFQTHWNMLKIYLLPVEGVMFEVWEVKSVSISKTLKYLANILTVSQISSVWPNLPMSAGIFWNWI